MGTLLHRLARFYRRVYCSVTDFEFYKTVYSQRAIKTVAYLILLQFNASLILGIVLSWSIIPEMSKVAQWTRERFPTLTRRDGRITVDQPLPYLIRYPGLDAPTLIFAESHEVKVQYQPPAYIFAPDGIYQAGNSSVLWRWSDLDSLWPGSEDGRLDGALLGDWIESARWALFPILTLRTLVEQLLNRGLEALIFSVFSYSAGLRFERRLERSQYFNIAVYALTPAVLTEVLGVMVGLKGDTFFELIRLTTVAIYTYKATVKIMGPEEGRRT